jgi:O-antigen/teichoic acid export membrane protein
MLLSMGVSLYTSRVVLNTLGIEDYGIYNIVGGVVAMFSIISGSLSSAIGRFLTFELGKKDYKRLKLVFSTSVTIQILLAVIILVLAETVGVWFLNMKMNIAETRMTAANWVLQFSILTFIVNLVSMPYNASIIAHERMKIFAYVGIIEVVLKLVIVYLLLISPIDKLIYYAILLFLVSVLMCVFYRIYCKNHFEECTYHFLLEKDLLTEMLGFAGWNFIGVSSALLKEQGVNIVLNLFFGTVVNAARGIAVQVNTAVHSFVSSFMTALNPQITKSFAAKEKRYMLTLVQQGARFSFYLLLFLSLPVIIDAHYVLTVWLKIVPEHTVNFVRLILILAMSESLSSTLITAMLATGKIKKYQIIVGGLQMMNLPVSYMFLKLGGIPEGTMIIAIVFSQCCLAARLWLLRGMIGLSAKKYLRQVYFNVLFVSVLSFILPYLVFSNMEEGFIRLLVVGLVSLISTTLIIYFVGCTQKERDFAMIKIMKFYNSKKVSK